jgi:nondiscriminating glutamyl-tRNA synthetase
MTKPRVRFAPSPTGFLHIGGARTALFNWLFARHTGGTFILRIEDTDEARSTEASVQAIFDGMKWMGLDWDEGIIPVPQAGAAAGAAGTWAAKGPFGPYFQMERAQQGVYKKYVDQLIAEGKAYPCYCTPEEVQKMRERAQLLKKPPKYDGTCRNLTPGQREKLAAEGRTASVRFKSPVQGTTEFDDVVRGPMKFENELIEDFVIQKTSGIPTYNFACVVDDHLMEITHVIRGDDHLSNTPRQALCYKALGWGHPVFAHLSMILGSDGSRLSKRHGATAVGEYETLGYLPEAVRNYIALLGWSTEDSQDIFGPEELVQKFTLERCGKSPCIFDTNKLVWMNGEYLRKMPLAEVVARSMPFLRQAGYLKGREEERRGEIERALALEHEKMKLLSDAPKLIDFFFKDVEYDPAAVEKVLKKPEAHKALESALAAFQKLEPFTAASTEEACKAVAASLGAKNAAVFHPVRVATSGRTQGPSLFHYLEVLGRAACVARIRQTLQKFFAAA